MCMQFYHYVSVRSYSVDLRCMEAGKTCNRNADTSCMALQTQVVARTQAILTQLMFDHALKMRAKASASGSTDKNATPRGGGKGDMPAITNLVTTDLTNVTNASTFVLLICECARFKWQLWRSAAEQAHGSARDPHPSGAVCGFLVFHSWLEVSVIFDTECKVQSLI